MTETKEGKYEYLSEDPNVKTWLITVPIIIGAFFAFLNETLLNIALITIMDVFSVTLPTVQWVATGFMLVMGIIVPVSPLFMQWFTTRQLFIGTMSIFTIGTFIAAIAPTFSILLLARFIQAVGTGLLMPIMFNVFLLLYPPHKRGKIMGFVGLVMMSAPAIGPSLSGVIVDFLGWRFLFITVIPFALFSMFFGYKYLINVSELTKPKADWISIILSTIGFGATIYGFSSVGQNETGFLTPYVLWSLFIGIVCITLFVIRQLKLDEPLIDLRVFKLPMYSLGVLMFVITVMIMLSSELILPIFMQGTMALSPAAAGLVLLPGSILNGIMSPFMGALFDKVGPKVMMVPATIILAATMFLFSRLTADTAPAVIIVGFILLMISVSAIMMPAETNGMNQLPRRLYPHGTAVFSTLHPLSGAIGVSVFISLLNTKQANYLETVANPQTNQAITDAMVIAIEYVYLIIFLLAVVAVILSFFMYRARPIEDKIERDKRENI